MELVFVELSISTGSAQYIAEALTDRAIELNDATLCRTVLEFLAVMTVNEVSCAAHLCIPQLRAIVEASDVIA